jgi:WD40 repeat protein
MSKYDAIRIDVGDSSDEVAFSSDSRLIGIATVGPWLTPIHKKLHLWEVQSGAEVQHLKNHYFIAFSPVENLFATISDDDHIRLWDITQGCEVQKIALSGFIIGNLAFSPDGRLLATDLWDKTIRLWDVQSGQEARQLKTPHSVEHLTFSPDGKMLAAVTLDQSVRVWNIASGQEIHRLEETALKYAYMSSVDFSPDSRLLATVSGHVQHIADARIRVWDVRDWHEVVCLQEPATGMVSQPNTIAFSPDGAILASGSVDRIVRLWDWASGQEVRHLKGHTQPVLSMVFSPDRRLLASSSNDQTVRLWNLNVPDTEWHQMKQAWHQRQEKQRQAWQEQGCCEACGTPLHWWSKILKRTRCQKHR